jgi:hypothetical protein
MTVDYDPFHPYTERAAVKDAVDDEDDLVDFTTEQLEYHGWSCMTETKPDRSDYRADIVANHDRYGWLGVEAKCSPNPRPAFAEAFKQVTEQYWNREFAGKPILMWAILIWDKEAEWLTPTGLGLSFIWRYGLGLFYGTQFNTVKFKHNQQALSIPVSVVSHNESGTADQIREFVKERRRETPLSTIGEGAQWR